MNASARFTSRRLVAGSLAWLGASALCACGGNGSQATMPSLSTALAVRTTDLGALPQNPDILGRDGAYSALFQGHSVWLYGDTFLASPNASGRTLVSNTWSFTSHLNASGGIAGFQERVDSAGAPSMVLVETAAEATFNNAHYGNPCQVQPCGARWAIWPSSIFADPVTGTAFVFYMVVSAMPGNFNFQSVGSSVAIWSDFAGLPQRPTFDPPLVAGHPDLMFDQNEPNFGSATVEVAGTLYVYGCGLPTNGFDKGCRLARVNPRKVQDRGAWTFYAGGGRWSPSVADAVSIFSGNDILSVSWNGYLQRYLAVYSVPFSQDVVIRTSPAPQGPWSDSLLAFVAMSPTQGNTYDALAHSEYDAGGGSTIYASYSRATGIFVSEVRLVSIQLMITGPLP